MLHAGESSVFGKNAFTTTLQEDEFLSPNVAFKLNLSRIDSQNISANFAIAPGYYLYKQRIKFVIKDAATGKINAVQLPIGDMKNDPNFGQQEVYHQAFSANINLSSAKNPIIIASYQGCSEKGLCYAPISKTIAVNITYNQSNAAADIGDSSLFAPNIFSIADDDKTTTALKSGNLWLIVGGFFLAGLLLSFTPCVLPMIPILSSIIIGSQNRKASQNTKASQIKQENLANAANRVEQTNQADQASQSKKNNASNQTHPSKMHAFGLSVAYVLGMALSYTLAGVAAGLSGSLLSQSLQSPLVLGITALVFVVLAFSMFGFYELKLPAFIEYKILNTSQKLKGGEWLGVFIMGVLSALIVSPCVAAPLAGALIYIGQTNNVFLGGLSLFALALGMGVPLLLIGASAGSLLPKTGNWMTIVRNFFGALMLAMAAYLVWPVLPIFITAPINRALGQGQENHLPFNRVSNIGELNAAIKSAKGKVIMLDFYADWCVACKEMEKFTFSDASVKYGLKDTVLLQVDVTKNDEDDKALLQRFNLFGPPGIIFFDASGNEIKPIIIGYKNAQDFSDILNKVFTINKANTAN